MKLPVKDKRTMIIALRYAIAHVQGSMDDKAEGVRARSRAKTQWESFQDLHECLTGSRFQT